MESEVEPRLGMSQSVPKRTDGLVVSFPLLVLPFMCVCGWGGALSMLDWETPFGAQQPKEAAQETRGHRFPNGTSTSPLLQPFPHLLRSLLTLA